MKLLADHLLSKLPSLSPLGSVLHIVHQQEIPLLSDELFHHHLMIEMVLMTQDGLLRSVVAKAVIYLIENMLIRNGLGTGTGNAVVIGTGIGEGIKSEIEKGIGIGIGIEKGSGIQIEIETEGMIMNIVLGIVEEIMRGVAMMVLVTIEKVVPVGAEAGAGAEAEAEVKMC